jgi:hypothetical protein
LLDEIAPLVRAGVSVILLHERQKRPIGEDWSNQPTKTLAELKKAYRDGNNVGIRLGKWSEIEEGEYLHCIDVDIRDPARASEARAKLKELFPGVRFARLPTVQSGSGGESRHVYFTTSQAFPSRKLAHSANKIVGADGKQHWAWEIDLFGTGKQVAAPPSIHPDTGKPYRWLVEADFIVPPHIDVELIESFFEDEDKGVAEGAVGRRCVSDGDGPDLRARTNRHSFCEGLPANPA